MKNGRAKFRVAATGLASLLVVLGALAGADSQSYPGADSTPTRPLVHLFEWPWADVAAECETFLGPHGYGAVQISPPQEHVVLSERGFPWWQRYQPVSYRLDSRGGNRREFMAMVQRCRRAGVAIYADAVINHMAGFEAGVGSAGTEFTKYHYPGLYNLEDFNPCRQPITNYQDATNVTQCELVGLADLNTSSPRVQATIVNYLKDLVKLGVSGFRIDAAKHMRAQEVGQILTQLQHLHPTPLFIYQEVIDPGSEAIRKQEYYANGRVIEFQYGQYVSEAFWGYNGQTLANLQTLGESWGLAPSDQAVVFIDNHDKQRGHGGGGNYLTHRDGALYTLANVFMLAYPYGRPQVMSSFAFLDSDQGPPTYPDGTTRPIYQRGEAQCFGEWVCEHRWPEIASMVAFRNGTQAVFEVTDWWSNGHNQIAFGRGELGFVVINGETKTLTQTFQTQLPEGRYCNILARGERVDGSSCQAVITVNRQGQFTTSLAGLTALALYGGSQLP